MKSTLSFCLSGLLATVVFTSYFPGNVSAQLIPNSSTPTNLTFPASGFNLNVFTNGPENGGLDVGQPGKAGMFTITTLAPDGSMVLGQNGVGIGLDGFASGTGQPAATLHVVGGGQSVSNGDAAFGNARILVEDRNPAVGFREMLTLTNQSGGGARIAMIDGPGLTSVYTLDNFNGRFNIFNNSLVPLSIAQDVRDRIEIGFSGVGIGTAAPSERLHVFTDGSTFADAQIKSEVSPSAGVGDRASLTLQNFGGTFMTFKDSSQNTTTDPFKGTWFFSNKNDELFIKKGGAGKPGLRFFANGDCRFVNNFNTTFAVFANGDVRAFGAYLSNSDRNIKENIESVSPAEVLEKLVELPIATWNYIADEADTTHMGPMAQDFHAAFGLGNDDKTIAELDKDGVAFAAIQGLNQKVEDENAKLKQVIQDQAGLIKSQQDQMAELEDRLNRLEALVAPQGK